MKDALAWFHQHADQIFSITILAYTLMTLIGYSVRRLPVEKQAELSKRIPRLVSFAYVCSSLAGQLMTLAEAFLPLLTGKPMPRFKRFDTVPEPPDTEPDMLPTIPPPAKPKDQEDTKP